MKRERVTSEAFVRAWQGSSSRAEVAQKTGLGLSGVSARHERLVRAGVKLKDMRRACTIDAVALNRLIEAEATEAA